MQAISWGRTLNFTKRSTTNLSPASQPIREDVGVNPCLFALFFGVPKVGAKVHWGRSHGSVQAEGIQRVLL